jgi:hypothetical protein
MGGKQYGQLLANESDARGSQPFDKEESGQSCQGGGGGYVRWNFKACAFAWRTALRSISRGVGRGEEAKEEARSESGRSPFISTIEQSIIAYGLRLFTDDAKIFEYPGTRTVIHLMDLSKLRYYGMDKFYVPWNGFFSRTFT